MAFDLIIQGGRVVDGTGNPWFWADVGIAGDRVSAIGDLSAAEARTMIDATGLVVCPGFIDIHSHSDQTLLANPRAESMVRQGVTTQVTGNCGFSPAPAAREGEAKWCALGEYLDGLRASGVSTNVAALIGHGQVRETVLGAADRAPAARELTAMRDLVAQAMEEGAFGMSSGLAYAPGLFSSVDELIELARVVARYGGIYTSHIRDESSQRAWRESVQEAIQVGEQGGLAVEISHLESHYPNWGGEQDILALLEEARSRGLDVSCDVPPYVCGATTLTTILPNWAHEGGPAKIVRRLRDPGERERIRQFVLTQREQQASPPPTMLADGLGDHIWLASSEGHPDLTGKSLAEIGELWGTDAIDASFDLIVADRATTFVVVEQHNEEDIRTLVRHPLSMIVSDGSAYAPYGALGAERPHPRSYGVFPLVYRKYVRGETRPEEPREVGAQILTLQEAVRKMTSYPAQKLGLQDRGLLRKGMWADMVLLDPQTIEDRATYEAPHQYPRGIPYVLVNGTLVVDRGEHTGALPGKVLQK